jgi:phenylacetate-CoA ligase
MLSPLSPALVRKVIYPVYRKLRRDGLFEALDELEGNQWLSPHELKELQWSRLVDFLRHITTHVPYYRDLFEKSKLSVEDIKSPSDFWKIPILTKEEIRKAGQDIITTEPMRKGVRLSTSGSTGEPLYFDVDESAGPVRRASAIRSLRWIGIDVGDRQAMLWGSYFGVSQGKHLADAVKNYFNNLLYLSAFNMSEEAMQKGAMKLRRFKPDLINGFPSALSLFAEFCKSHRISDIRPRAIRASGEKIYAHQQQLLEEVFRCPVFDGYGTNEFSNIAHQCGERNGYHIAADLFYVEILRENGRHAEEGEVGEITVTDLSNRYMPFLRYRTGDLAVPTNRTCPCGRTLPLLDRIEGRTFDVVVSPEGKSAGGFFWTFLSRAVPGIRRFQIEQRERSGVIFRIAPGPDWKDASKADLESKIKQNFGEGFRVDFEIVDDIPPAPSGKFRFIISKLGERLVVKSKIHKAVVTGEALDDVDSIVIDEELLELSNIAPSEKVLIVDNTNGARLETFVRKGPRGSGDITITGASASLMHKGDEIIVMAFTWSESEQGDFKNILVDENNRFVRYLAEIAGEKA